MAEQDKPETIEAIAREMLAYEAEQFDYEPMTLHGVEIIPDINVSGGDLVDAFAAWREGLKVALA